MCHMSSNRGFVKLWGRIRRHRRSLEQARASEMFKKDVLLLRREFSAVCRDFGSPEALDNSNSSKS